MSSLSDYYRSGLSALKGWSHVWSRRGSTVESGNTDTFGNNKSSGNNSSAVDASVASATELLFEELIAQKPHRWPSTLPAGLRGPDGERIGRGRARSLSFDGVSPYQEGDDPRWVDWRATARSGKLQVKRFAAQSHRARIVVLKLDSSLFFATTQRLMAKSAALMAARLVFDAQVINEPVGLVCCAQQPDISEQIPPKLIPPKLIPPKRGRRHLWLLLESIQQQYNECAVLARQSQTTQLRISNSHTHNHAQGPAQGNDAALLEALETAQGMLAKGDDICLVDELVQRDHNFEDWCRATAARRQLSCYLITDALMHGNICAGRFPARALNIEQPSSYQIASRDVDTAREALLAYQVEQTNRMRTLGWQVNFANDLLSTDRSLQ